MKTRLKKLQQARRGGRFRNQCRCILHQDDKKVTAFEQLQSGRRVTKKQLDYMIDNKLLTNVKGSICSECISDVNCRLARGNKESAGAKSTDDESSDEQFASIAGGSSSLSPPLQSSPEACPLTQHQTQSGAGNDTKNISFFAIIELMDNNIPQLYKKKSCFNVEKALTYCPIKWLEERPQLVVDCFSRLCKMEANSKPGAFWIAKSIEQVHKARNSRLVLPSHFRHNLISYTLTGSKQVVRLNSSTSPAGSYTFVSNWLTENAKNEIVFPESTVRVVFDNEQVVGKRYGISIDNSNTPISVITSHAKKNFVFFLILTQIHFEFHAIILYKQD